MIWVISGTQDGRELAKTFSERTGKDVVITVVSEYGKLLAAESVSEVVVGRLTQADMENLITTKEITTVIDASHPYAAIVSETARAACKNKEVAYIRYERPETVLPDYEKLHLVDDEEAAAELAGRLGEKIYLTTGSKTLHVFLKSDALKGKEVWARVLPTPDVIQLCHDLGMIPKYIVALQGPFSYEMNKAMFRDTKADVIVMKNSGLIGGTDTKLAAAMDLVKDIVVINRPQAGSKGFPIARNTEEAIKFWEEL